MTAAEKEVRLAKLYDAEILPAYATRFAALLTDFTGDLGG